MDAPEIEYFFNLANVIAGKRKIFLVNRQEHSPAEDVNML